MSLAANRENLGECHISLKCRLYIRIRVAFDELRKATGNNNCNISGFVLARFIITVIVIDISEL